MKTIRTLILEDDLKTLAVIMDEVLIPFCKNPCLPTGRNEPRIGFINKNSRRYSIIL